MNERVFLDTSGLLCAHSQNDFRHATAVAYIQQAQRLMTTNYVLAEFVPLAQVRGHDREESLSYINDLLLVPRLEIVWIDEILHGRAMRLLEARLDKNYSLCDAVSFLVIREHQYLSALTTDKHFAQEGFVKLLES